MWLPNGCYPSYPLSSARTNHDSRQDAGKEKATKTVTPNTYTQGRTNTSYSPRQYSYFGIFRKMSKTYHEAHMIGRIFPFISRQLKLVRHSDQFYLHPIVRRLRAEGTSTFCGKAPTQPTCTVYQ